MLVAHKNAPRTRCPRAHVLPPLAVARRARAPRDTWWRYIFNVCKSLVSAVIYGYHAARSLRADTHTWIKKLFCILTFSTLHGTYTFLYILRRETTTLESNAFSFTVRSLFKCYKINCLCRAAMWHKRMQLSAQLEANQIYCKWHKYQEFPIEHGMNFLKIKILFFQKKKNICRSCFSKNSFKSSSFVNFAAIFIIY